ncbi:MAG: hypothetical protein OEY26_08900, partial [Nitrospinota bacterium]|nr:hypothetical protein [Nitrospinota bacterium]
MRKVKMDMYTKYFLLKRRTTITLSVWLLMGLLGAFLEAASSTNGSWIIGVFNDPLASLPGLNQRFLFYSFRISGLIYLCIFGHYYISGFRKIDISQTNLSEEYIRRNSIVARYLVTIM